MQSEKPSAVPASQVELSEFRQILIWPLTLDRAGAEAAGDQHIADLVRREADRLDSEATPNWKRVDDPLHHLRREAGPLPSDRRQRQETYAEFVYFHDFVQRFLYPKPDRHKSGTSLLHLFERDDVRGVRIEQFTGRDVKSFTLVVERCNLYLFPVGVAVLAVEVTTAGTGSTIALADALWLQDGFRRCYVPWFAAPESDPVAPDGSVVYAPRDVSTSVVWLGADDKPILPPLTADGDPAYRFDRANDFVIANREPPILEHWGKLLPLLLARDHGGSVRWRHIVDERIPIMTYACVAQAKGVDGVLSPGANLARIERGDLMRLCFADTPGSPESLPYDRLFLENFEAKHCYRRFQDMGTLHMFAGYCYVVLTAEGPNYPAYLVNHFRHMYFQMALISHMEMATYLAFSSRVSQAVEQAYVANTLSDQSFRDKVIRIQEEFLRFVHLFRFTGISNQLQAKELYDEWRRHLGLHALYDDVRGELESATQFLFATEAREHTAEAREHTMAAMMLNRIAIGGVIMGLALSFLGINLIWDAESLKVMLGTEGNWSLWTSLGRGVLALGATLAGIATLARFALPRWLGTAERGLSSTATPPAPKDERHAPALREINTLLRTVVAVGLGLAFVGLVSNAIGYAVSCRWLGCLISLGFAVAVGVGGWKWWSATKADAPRGRA